MIDDVEQEQELDHDNNDDDNSDEKSQKVEVKSTSLTFPGGPTIHDHQEEEEDEESSTKAKQQQQQPLLPRTKAQMIFGWAMGDVLVYVTIINLFVEYIPQMRMDSFTISIVTSIVLKLVLEGVHYLQHIFQHFFCVQRKQRIIGAFFIWLVLFSSKFVILWIDETLFPNRVDLGGVTWILVLSAVLMIAEKLLRLIWWQLGKERPCKNCSCNFKEMIYVMQQ